GGPDALHAVAPVALRAVAKPARQAEQPGFPPGSRLEHQLPGGGGPAQRGSAPDAGNVRTLAKPCAPAAEQDEADPQNNRRPPRELRDEHCRPTRYAQGLDDSI